MWLTLKYFHMLHFWPFALSTQINIIKPRNISDLGLHLKTTSEDSAVGEVALILKCCDVSYWKKAINCRFFNSVCVKYLPLSCVFHYTHGRAPVSLGFCYGNAILVTDASETWLLQKPVAFNLQQPLKKGKASCVKHGINAYSAGGLLLHSILQQKQIDQIQSDWLSVLNN